jgi:hypothetical protein
MLSGDIVECSQPVRLLLLDEFDEVSDDPAVPKMLSRAEASRGRVTGTGCGLPERNQNLKNKKANRIAVYHRVYASEDLEHAARTLYELTYMSQQKVPGAERLLRLDIDGHRDRQTPSGFDDEMYRLMYEFIIPSLMEYLTEAHLPIGLVTHKDGKQQNDEIPKVVIIESCPGKIPDEKRHEQLLVSDSEMQEIVGSTASARDDDRATVIFRRGEKQS